MSDASVCEAALKTFENGVFFCELPDGHIGLHCVRDESMENAPFFVVWAEASPKRRAVSIPSVWQDVPEVESVTTVGNTGDTEDAEYVVTPYARYQPSAPVLDKTNTVVAAIDMVLADDAETWMAIAASECAILSEPVLAKAWDTPAEDEAWRNL